jgi:predicted acyltransferase
MQPPSTSTRSSRIRSIDIARGLTILVMLFVNDLAGVTGAPGWMKHIHPSTADGYTFVDVVFPAFLFIVGLSLPIALGNRLKRGESTGKVLGHILIRTLGLLAMGVLMVNSGGMTKQGVMSPQIWQLLLYTAAILVWVAPGGEKKWSVQIRRLLGIALLIVLALAYRTEAGLWLRPHWWGILGLIGWAYLVTAGLYLLFRRTTTGFAAATLLLYGLYSIDQSGLLAFLEPINSWIGIGSVLGSQPAITASGALLSMLIFVPERTHGQRIRITLIFTAVFGTAGILLHTLNTFDPQFIYNKNAATVPWCLVTSAWTALIFSGIYWLADDRGVTAGTRTLTAAGQNALFAFILGPIAYLLIDLIPPILHGTNPYHGLGAAFSTGFWRSLLFALAGTWFTACLHRSGRYLRM